MVDYGKTDTYEDTDVADCIADTHTLLLHNDDFNSFNFVIDCLIKICKHEEEQATQCAYLVHYTGKTDIMHGELSKLQSCKTALTDRGLSATIERN